MSDTQNVAREVMPATEFLRAYVEMWNASQGQATLEQFAEKYDMTVPNVRQRVYGLKKKLAERGKNLEIMRTTDRPRSRKPRTNVDELADIVGDMFQGETVESSETPQTDETV